MAVLTCLCGSQKFELLMEGEYSYITVQGKPIPFQALKCLNCGIVATNPPPSDEYIFGEELDPWGEALIGEEIWSHLSSKYKIRRLKPYLNSSARVLEIGCSTGKLVEMASRAGVAESIGLEKSERKVALGRLLGRNIVDKYLDECNFPSNYFDIIQAHHVLEHIPNLKEVLNEVHRILKTNGIFYVIVPRYNSIFTKNSPNWEGWYPQKHFWHFTDKTLVKLLAEHGFEVMNLCCTLPSEYSTIKDNFWVFRKSFKVLVKKLNWGDILEVMFRKMS
jgi:SAM-dependent methyltransferase